MSDDDCDYRPTGKVNKLYERNTTRSYSRVSESEDANFFKFDAHFSRLNTGQSFYNLPNAKTQK